MRTINLYLHERCLSTLNKEQLNYESTSSDLCENNSLPKDTTTSEPQHSPDTFTEGQVGCSNSPSTVIAPGNMNTTAPSFMPPTGMISENQIPSVSESQTSDASVNNITVDPSLNLHYFAETHPTSVSAVQVNTSTLPQYPTLWAPSFDPPQPGDPSPSLLVQNIPHQNPFNPCYQLDTGTTSHYCYDAVPGISSAITSYQSPNNSQSHLQSQKSANTCLSTSMSPGIITSFPQPATRPCLFPNTINNHNLPTSAQHPSTVQPGSYVGNTHIPIPQHAPVPIASINPPLASPFVPSRMSMDPNIQIKKMSLPTFSGQRKDWPEFKAVWKSVAEAVYANKTARLMN